MPQQDQLLEGGAFIAFLNELEDQLDPASFEYPDFNYWPILRFAINYKRKMGKSLRQGEALEISTARRRWLKVLGHLRRPADPPSIPSKLQMKAPPGASPDVLFVNRKRQYVPGPEGAWVQPFTDGLRHVLGDTAPACMTLLDRHVGGDYLIEPHDMPKTGTFRTIALLEPRNARDLALRDAILDRLAHLNSVLAGTAPHLQLSEKDILVNIEQASARMQVTRAFLEKLAPKLVFLSSYTGAYFICAAARSLGITVVDIQHGGMHRHHPLAANWHKVPAGGYALLPDVFWCWTNRSAGYISDTMPACHQAIVGGNPKAALEQMLAPHDLAQTARGDRPQILVALQYGAEDLVKPHVLEAHARTRDTADWHFRLHPMGWDRRQEAVKLLQVDENMIVTASRVPLQQQLAGMDLLVTNNSTIVHEAIDHGVQPVVCAELGAMTFDDLIQSGALLYAPDVEILCQTIAGLETNPDRNAETGNRAPSGIAQIRQTFATLLEQSGR